MHNELDALEQKLGQFLELCQRLRIENQELRDRNAALEAERQRLADKVEEARSRLEALIAKLPET
jgi:cell division protein ZapB